MIIAPPPKITNRKSFLNYIEINLWSWLRDLTSALLRITFQENFQSFTVANLLIPANTEVAIPNDFRRSYPGNIPSSRIITRQKGNAIIIDGVTMWSANLVYLQNVSANDATITVIFFI